MRAERAADLPRPGFAPRANTRVREHHDRSHASARASLREQQRTVGHVGMGPQIRLHGGEVESFLADLHHPVGAPAQVEAAIRKQLDAIAHGEARLARFDAHEGRAHPRNAGRIAKHTDGSKRSPGRIVRAVRLAPPGHATRLGRSEHLDGNLVQRALDGAGRLGRKRPARGEDHPQAAPKPGCGSVVGEPPEVSRHARQAARAGSSQPCRQLLRVEEVLPVEGAPGGERPEHAEEQTVQVVVRGGGEDGAALERRPPHFLETADLVLQLPDAFAHPLAIARAARREELEGDGVSIERRERVICAVAERIDRGSRDEELGAIRQRARRAVGQARERLGSRVGREERRAARVPEAQQGYGARVGVVASHEPLAAGPAEHAIPQPRHLHAEVRPRHRLVAGLRAVPAPGDGGVGLAVRSEEAAEGRGAAGHASMTQLVRFAATNAAIVPMFSKIAWFLSGSSSNCTP